MFSKFILVSSLFLFWFNNITSCEYTTFRSCIISWWALGCLCPLATKNVAMGLHVQVHLCTCFHMETCFFGIHVLNWIAGSSCFEVALVLRSSQSVFSKVAAPFYFSLANTESFQFLHVLTSSCPLFFSWWWLGMKWCLIVFSTYFLND